MIDLQKLEKCDFEIFKSWITSEDELFQFAGPIFSYPLTDDQLLRYISDERRIAYKVILIETKTVIGNAELNFEKPLPRLSRILIGNKHYRNIGLGEKVIRKLLEKLFLELNYTKADLNVFDWNKAAIRCYEKVGFKINPDVVVQRNFNGKVWTTLNMIINNDAWQ